MKRSPYYQLPDDRPRKDHTQVTAAGILTGFMLGIAFLILADLILKFILS